MIVYLDLIFLMNLLIDGALLYTTAWMRGIRFAWWRLLLAAVVGASYVVFMFIPEMSFLFTFLVKFCFALVMLVIAFGYASLQYFARNVVSFYMINFVAAGGIIGIHYLLESSSEMWEGVVVSQTGGISHQLSIGLTFIVILIGPVLAFYKKGLLSARRREELTSFFAEVKVYIDQVEATCVGLIDTGNQLYDPLTRTPVMIMEAKEWKEHLPDKWLKRIEQAEVEQMLMGIGEEEDGAAFVWQDRLRLVPYRGVNRATQFMLALKPDRVVITYQNKSLESPKVLIGLDGGKLSSDNSYQAIIHPMLMQA
jgi:stage II sporulation protein GA (sporulation sigma-E factor processing peptidase)